MKPHFKRLSTFIMRFAFILMALLPFGLFAQSTTFILKECERPKDQDFLNARTTIAREWNITYKVEPTCDIDPSFKEWIRKNNLKVGEKIAEEKGENWMADFSALVKQELAIQKAAKQLIMLNEQVAKLDSNNSNGGAKILLRKKPGNVYAALVVAADDWEDQCQMLVYFKIIVDPNTQSITVKSDKIQPLR